MTFTIQLSNYATDSNLYNKYRPCYPQSFLKRIPELVFSQSKCALDIACGTGILARQISPYFDNILGIDNNPGQISIAKQTKSEIGNIGYVVFEGTKLDEILNSQSINARDVGLVSIDEAFHWLKTDLFLENFHETFPEGTILFITSYTKPNLPSKDQLESFREKQTNYKSILDRKVNDFQKLSEIRQLVSGFYSKMMEFSPVNWDILENAYKDYMPQFKKYFDKIYFEEELVFIETNLYEFYLELKTSSSYNNYLQQEREKHGNRKTTDWLIELINNIYQVCFGTDLKISSHNFANADIEKLKAVQFPIYYYFFCYFLL